MGFLLCGWKEFNSSSKAGEDNVVNKKLKRKAQLVECERKPDRSLQPVNAQESAESRMGRMGNGKGGSKKSPLRG